VLVFPRALRGRCNLNPGGSRRLLREVTRRFLFALEALKGRWLG